MIAGLLLALGAAEMPMAPPSQACTGPVKMPGFEAWGLPSATAPAFGQEAALTLRPAAAVTYAPPPARAPQPGSFGGVFPLEVSTPGTYAIALSAGVWIDLVRDGARIESVAHQPGLACSGIRKVVSFALKPGHYLIQLSEAKAPEVKLMVTDGVGAAPNRPH